MKKVVNFLVVFSAAVLLLAGCGTKALSGKPGSSGKTLELMVVAKNNAYAAAKSQIDTLFLVPQDGLNQPESRFDVVQIAPSSFEGNTMFQAHRNILQLEIDPQGLNKVYLEQDKWSTPQVVIRITAQDARALDSLLVVYGPRLLKEYYNQEYRRMAKVFSQTPDIKIINRLKEKFGITLAIPEEFMLAKMEEVSNFSWVLKQTKDFDLHLFIFTWPKAQESLSVSMEPSILDAIDTVLRRYVPGPSEGSYPGVEHRDFFYSRMVTLGDDIKAVETRGLWRTYNDFMGGPFVSYTFLSPGGEEMMTLVGCVYSPSQRNKMVMKRDLLMQLDGICRSLKFE